MINCLLFDIGDTIINNLGFDFKEGLKIAYEHLTIKNILFDSFIKDGYELLDKMYKTRKIDNIEIKYTDYLKTLILKYNNTYDISLDELELLIYKNVVTDSKILEVYDVLEYCKSKNIKMYIFSNSTFSSQCLKWTLKEFGLIEYFIDVFSSSDIGYRKPIKAFYEATNIDIELDKTIFIGNDNYFDGNFARNIGVKFGWYNRKCKENNLKLATFEFKNYKEFKENLEQNYDR